MCFIVYEGRKFRSGKRPKIDEAEKQFFDSILAGREEAHNYNLCPIISYHTICTGIVNGLNETLTGIRRNKAVGTQKNNKGALEIGIGYLIGVIYSVKAVQINETFTDKNENCGYRMKKLYSEYQTNTGCEFREYRIIISDIEAAFENICNGLSEETALLGIEEAAGTLVERLNSDKSNLRLVNYADNRITGSSYDMEDYEIIKENNILKIDVSGETAVSVRLTNLLHWTLMPDAKVAICEEGVCYLLGVTGGRGYFVYDSQKAVFVSALVPEPALGMKIKYRDFFWKENREIEFAL